jgi:purine-cytosine permease-like protein
MALLWITMVTIFPCVLVGFEWHKQGFTLGQVLSCTMLSCLILLLYTVPTAQLAARTGKSYALLNRDVFGKVGATLLNANLLWIFVAFYGLSAMLMAEGMISIFHLPVALPLASGVLALLMAFNNFFGFRGIANFARYIAAPALILWVGYTFLKTVPTCPMSAIVAAPQQSFLCALTAISTFVIGVAVWGNEADYWRYGQPKKRYATCALACALAVGQVIFPATGWMVAHMTGITEYGAATDFMNTFSFAGLPALGGLVLFASYFACNDSNMFGSASALENLTALSHRQAVIVLTFFGIIAAVCLSYCGSAKAVEAIASVNCVLLPPPTVIVLTEWFITSCVLKGEKFGESKLSRWPAYTALALAVAVGLLTSGLPGLERLHAGIPALQCWLLAAFTYFGLRLLQYSQVASASRSAAPLSVSLFSAAPELLTGKQIQRIVASARGERD